MQNMHFDGILGNAFVLSIGFVLKGFELLQISSGVLVFLVVCTF